MHTLQIYDPESNSYYYWNLKTNEPSWTKPVSSDQTLASDSKHSN